MFPNFRNIYFYNFMSINNQKMYGFGCRKQAIAQVIMTVGTGVFMINKKPISKYFKKTNFSLKKFQFFILHFKLFNLHNTFVKVLGGGLESQISAIILAISRLFFKKDFIQFLKLKNLGFLKQDLRMKERKKYGLLKARKAPQFSKR